MSELVLHGELDGGQYLRDVEDPSAAEHTKEGLGRATLNKVPEVALEFRIIKIAATTLGETGGDALSMSLNLGYLVSTVIFFVLFLLLVTAQIKAKRFHPFLYRSVIVGTTLAGTTMADFADLARALDIRAARRFCLDWWFCPCWRGGLPSGRCR